jgi:hypothetical protein
MSNLGSISLEIHALSRAVVFARDRILQGDWTHKYGNQQLELQAKECQEMLAFYGCKEVEVYAHVSTVGRGLMKWTYIDPDGERFNGLVHPRGF